MTTNDQTTAGAPSAPTKRKTSVKGPRATTAAAAADPKSHAAAGSRADPSAPTGEDAEPRGKELQVLKKHVDDVATGKIPFDQKEGHEHVRVCYYGYALLNVLADTLGLSQKETVLLAVCYYARALTSATVSTQNDLAMQLHALQFAVQDFNYNVEEVTTLTVAVSNQEVIAGGTGVTDQGEPS